MGELNLGARADRPAWNARIRGPCPNSSAASCRDWVWTGSFHGVYHLRSIINCDRVSGG